MSQVTPSPRIHARRLRELDERVQRAWHTYRDSLGEVAAADYGDAEERAWDRLQRRLKDIADERAALSRPTPRRPGSV